MCENFSLCKACYRCGFVAYGAGAQSAHDHLLLTAVKSTKYIRRIHSLSSSKNLRAPAVSQLSSTVLLPPTKVVNCVSL